MPLTPGEQVDGFLCDRLLPASGAVNCDVMGRRLSRRNLLRLAEVMSDGVALIHGLLGKEEERRDTAEQRGAPH